MAIVCVRNAAYDLKILRPVVFELLEAMDGNTIGAGTHVLLKPNLLAPAYPEQAITTHPLVVRCAAEYALERGAKVLVSDSNAMGSFQKTVERTGLIDVLKDLPVTIAEFTESVKVKTESRFLVIELAKDALEADVIINLPKLKTHQQMGMTLAVKNLFGCVVGLRKPEWHFRVGEDKELFGELLATIFSQLKPGINLLDGILAMEGHGPGTGGTPREVGVLMGSTDAVALDRAVCAMVGMDPDGLYTTMAAKHMGFPGDYTIDGDLLQVDEFDIPDTRDLLFGPGFLKNYLRGHIASRPRNIQGVCRYCNECVKICPAKALTNPTGKRLNFDYEKCIRCYCCMEVCPYKAMEKHDTWVKKFVGMFIHSRR
jgi:uncharacterized protein (DUF362 family)/ferredoxin-like protein FixX